MRAHQAAELLNLETTQVCRATTLAVASYRFNIFEELWMRRVPSNSLCIFVKDSIRRMSEKTIYKMRAKGAVIAVDYLDANFREMGKIPTDIEIASSLSQLAYLQQANRHSLTTVLLCEHQADIKLLLGNYDFTDNNKLDRAIYWGEQENLGDILELNIDIDTHYVNSNQNEFTKILPQYKYHICVRPKNQYQDKTVFKPLTKIFNALAAGSIPIISELDHEALTLLGKKYPWTVEKLKFNRFKIRKEEADIELNNLIEIKQKNNLQAATNRYKSIIEKAKEIKKINVY